MRFVHEMGGDRPNGTCGRVSRSILHSRTPATGVPIPPIVLKHTQRSHLPRQSSDAALQRSHSWTAHAGIISISLSWTGSGVMTRCSPSCQTHWATSTTGSLCGSQSRSPFLSSCSRPSPRHRTSCSHTFMDWQSTLMPRSTERLQGLGHAAHTMQGAFKWVNYICGHGEHWCFPFGSPIIGQMGYVLGADRGPSIWRRALRRFRCQQSMRMPCKPLRST